MAAVVLVPCFAANVVRIPIKGKGADPLFQVHYGNKWGYMDRSGRTVVSPQFDDEGDFFSGLAKVQKNNKWGYANQTGQVVIPFQFDGAGDFSEGAAAVQSGRKWGLIDPTGRFVVQPQFQAAGAFHDGLARFEIWETIRCDRGTYTSENAPLYAFRLHDSVAGSAGCFSESARFGFIDGHGRIVVAPRLLAASDFSEGLSLVMGEQMDGLKYGYVDKTGKMVIGPEFGQASSFSEGLAAVGILGTDGGKERWRWGFIDHSGGFAIPLSFEAAGDFSEGLANVRLRFGASGYIDKTGALIIPARYQQANPFSDGLALVLPGDRDPEDTGYYIDKRGAKSLVPKLLTQWSFSGGLTVVGDQGRRIYIDQRGKVIAPYEVDPSY